MTDAPAQITDTPVTPITAPPVSRLDRFKAFVGDLARPWAIVSISSATAAAIVIAALRCEDGTQGGIVIGAAGLIVGGMYGFKEWGNTVSGKQAANVAIAQTEQPK